MGKNFSRNNSGKRKESDFYATHYSLTREFLLADGDWDRSLKISDSSCGEGAIVKVLKEFGFTNIYAKDLVQDGVDFLQDITHVAYSIMNPPYSLANEFILHAKEVVSHKFAMLLPLTYLQGSYRYNHIWLDTVFPVESVYVFNRFPMLGVELREDGKFPTGMQALCWIVWNKYSEPEDFCKRGPVIHWIDVDKYVLKKGDI